MDTATDPTRTTNRENNKRVRFSDSNQQLRQTAHTPIGQARFVANVTLPSLPPSIKLLAEQATHQYLSDLVELSRLAQNKARLDNADFLPHSARVKFQLGATSCVLEAYADKHASIKTNVDLAIDIFHITLNNHIREAITLEQKAMKALLLKRLCNTIGHHRRPWYLPYHLRHPV